jgi:threonine dehydrogenase-like Zn-dependent dehydrogenase
VRALVLDEDGLRLVPDHPDPEPRSGEAIVRVERAGICGTDLELLRGYKGFRGVPGHEFAGTVEWCGSKPELVGKRVTGEINVGCGRCDRCKRGSRQHCENRSVLGIAGRDGAFAERLRLPARNLHVLTEDVAFDAGVFVEPLAAAIHVLDQVEVRDRTRAVVLGPGRLGRLVAMALGSRTDHVTLVGREDPDPRDADVVVDCTGSPEGFERALAIVRPRGTVVLKSTHAAEAPVPASTLTTLVVNEIRVVGSRCGTAEDFEIARNSLLGRTIDVRPLVEATYPLEQFERAFEHAARPGALKVLLDPT